MKRETTHLIERENDWIWVELGCTYPSAADALKAVLYHDAEAEKVGISTVRTIEWEAITMSGKYAVLAITGRD